jgi:hypothetical protein
MSIRIVAIVEGRGEEKSAPLLLSKILQSMNVYTVQPDYKPVWQHRQKIVKEGQLEKAIELALRTRRNVGAVLILLDADDDCPAFLGPELLRRAQDATNLPVAVVLAKKEFEAWFLGCLESFRGFMGIPADVRAPTNPETLGAKGRIEGFCQGVKYLSSVHQVEFVSRMDLSVCRKNCDSFDKLWRDVEALVKAVAPVAGSPGARN